MPHILIVDADEALGLGLVELLESDGFSVELLRRGDEALARIESAPPDLVILDLLLPGLTGSEICRRTRERGGISALPIMILTALGSEADRVSGLDAGADDYVVKPFSARELVARIRALLRRSQSLQNKVDTLVVGDLVLDREAARVRRAGRDLRLGPIEFRLLEYMMERPGRAISRSQIKDGVWGSSAEVSDRAIDVSIGRLRRALSADDQPDPIRTVRGEGYRLDQ